MPGLSPELCVIFNEEFRRQLRRRSFTFFTLFVAVLMLVAIPVTPLFLELIFPVPTAPGENQLEKIGCVDLADVLRGSQDWPKPYNDTVAGIQAVQQGEIDALFVLPADYLESGEVEEYERPGSGRNVWGSAAEGAFADFLRHNLVAGQLGKDVMGRVLVPASYQKFQVEDDGAVSDEINATLEAGALLIPIFFGILLLVAVLTGSESLLGSVSEEKETRMIEMLVTTASPLSIMTGKLLALWTAGLIQMAAWVTVGMYALPAIFHQIPGGGELTISAGLLATIALSFVLGYFLLFVLALFIGVVSSSKAAQEYMWILSLLIAPPLYLVGLWMNVGPDHTLVQIFTWFPFSAPTMLMIRSAMGWLMSSGEIAAVLGIVAATGLLLLWVSARVFRASILLSGQRITPANVWSALRNAD